MADPDSRHETNVPGKWYVDENCIDCDLCYTAVPEVFKEHEDHSSVHAQPDENDEDMIRRCEEALEDCPVQAIGNDG